MRLASGCSASISASSSLTAIWSGVVAAASSSYLHHHVDAGAVLGDAGDTMSQPDNRAQREGALDESSSVRACGNARKSGNGERSTLTSKRTDIIAK